MSKGLTGEEREEACSLSFPAPSQESDSALSLACASQRILESLKSHFELDPGKFYGTVSARPTCRRESDKSL